MASTPTAAASAAAAANPGAAPLPAKQRWRWVSLPPLDGHVTVRCPLPSAEDGESDASAAAAVARILALVREGGLVGEWVEPEEERSSSSGSDEDDDNDEEGEDDAEDGDGDNTKQEEEDGRQKKVLPRLALRRDGLEAADASPLVLLETVGWSDACALTHALAQKSLAGLALLGVVHGKQARGRDEDETEESAVSAPPAPLDLHLTVRLRVRFCLNEAQPQLCPEHRKGELPKLLRLANMFLLTTAEDLPMPDRLLARRPRRRLAALFEEASASAGPAPPTRSAGDPSVCSSSASSSPLTARLADDVLGLIFSYFAAPDLRALGQACRFLSQATKSIVPGLKARLFPHQLRSLEWMLARETGADAGAAMGQHGGRSIPHPAWEELRGCAEVDGATSSCGCGSVFSLWVNLVDGRVAFSAGDVPRLRDARGGILADEMGLGKTVTALALILKTRGLLPSQLPPPASGGEEEGGGADEAAADDGGGFGGRFHFRSPQSRRRQVDPRELLPSSATLVVSPGPLLQHWREQVALHCEPWALDLGRHVLVDDAVDEKGRLLPLPPPARLAAYDVVVVSKERLRHEWRTGRPACALEERRPRRYSTMGYVELRPTAGGLSPLLQVRWLRVVVDEGHSLGSLSITHEVQMAKSLEAERRWAMTGTPHRHDAADLASLRELLLFLRQAPYGLWHDASWARLIGGGRGGGGGSGGNGPLMLPPALAERRLVSLLRRVMIRHTKTATDIPRPVLVRTRLRMSRLEANTYNTLVSLVQANLLTTGLEGGSHRPGALHPDSMLNPANKAESNTLLHNVRLACCGGGQQVVSLDAATVVETLNLARRFGCNGEDGSDPAAEARLAKTAAYLGRLRGNAVSACDACGVPLLILLITPCLHLLCCTCMRRRAAENVCARCLAPFDVDQFQLLQPGLSIHWREDDVLALPPASSTSNSAGASAAAAMQDGSPSAAASASNQDKEEEGAGSYVDMADDEEEGTEADDGSWRVVTKAWHMITVLKQYQEALLCPSSSSSSSKQKKLLPLKAVVFSQFRSYLNGLAAALRSQGFRVGCFFDKTRVQDLTRFSDLSPTTGLQVLLIGREGSHGLDLSMATHLFVMDQIFDRNLEDQVVSRAYRMGARAPCRVEFLSMKGTVEETMEALAAAASVASAGGGGSSGMGLGPTAASACGAEGSEDAGNGNGRGRGGKPKRRAASLTSQRRQSAGGGGGKSGTGAAGGGAEDTGRLQFLLQSLALVPVPEIRQAMRRASVESSPAAAASSAAAAAAGGGGTGAAASFSTEPPAAKRVVRFAGVSDDE